MQGKNIIVTIVIVLLAGAGSFYGGTVYEKNKLSQNFTQRGNVMGNNMPGGQNRMSDGQNRRQGGQNRNGSFVAGQIISKDDNSITVKTPDGGSKIIYFSDSTQIGKTTSGSSSDLAANQQVMLNGIANSDGSFTAQNIQIRPEESQQ